MSIPNRACPNKLTACLEAESALPSTSASLPGLVVLLPRRIPLFGTVDRVRREVGLQVSASNSRILQLKFRFSDGSDEDYFCHFLNVVRKRLTNETLLASL